MVSLDEQNKSQNKTLGLPFTLIRWIFVEKSYQYFMGLMAPSNRSDFEFYSIHQEFNYGELTDIFNLPKI